MNITTGYEPKCIACVDYYHDECHCPKSIYCGTSLSHIPWEGCPCYLSQRKWGGMINRSGNAKRSGQRCPNLNLGCNEPNKL